VSSIITAIISMPPSYQTPNGSSGFAAAFGTPSPRLRVPRGTSPRSSRTNSSTNSRSPGRRRREDDLTSPSAAALFQSPAALLLSPRTTSSSSSSSKRGAKRPWWFVLLLLPCLLWMVRLQGLVRDEQPSSSGGALGAKETFQRQHDFAAGLDAHPPPRVLGRDSSSLSPPASSSQVVLSSTTTTLSDLDPAQNPLIPQTVYEPKSARPISVIYIGTVAANSNTTTNDLPLLGALERSRYVRVVATYLASTPTHAAHPVQHEQWHNNNQDASSLSDEQVPLAIVVDWSSHRDCHILHRILSRHISQDYILDKAYLLLVDSTASARTVNCEEELFDDDAADWPISTERIRIAKRSVVEGRHWNHTQQWVEPGHLISSNHEYKNRILHLSGHISESYLNQLRFVFSEEASTRPIDVSHYWQSSENMVSSLYYTALRQRVTRQLNETQRYLARQESGSAKFVDRVGLSDGEEDMMIELEVSGDEEDDENNDAFGSTLHIALIASSKIVVVAQNDEWEDHDNRLLEAMGCGAMVLADAMLAPPVGLKNKTNIVFFDSPESLDRLIRYYLSENEKREAIARRGVKFALGRHRSWHVLEALLFGRALTRTDKEPYDEEGPAKRAHALSDQVKTFAL